MGSEDWYSNKDLFEMFEGMKADMGDLRTEMKETRVMIKQYNGLREQFAEVQNEIAILKNRAHIRIAFWAGIHKWGGWIVAVAMLVVTALSVFK